LRLTGPKLNGDHTRNFVWTHTRFIVSTFIRGFVLPEAVMLVIQSVAQSPDFASRQLLFGKENSG